ncbi:YybH family protein [Caballeronia sordidicola]|jgi:uncharacterized protein (TIGR02246 family)|uniref:YybH family protein n=1 Tax=Caballeronia sordidicola TaxID=196367 RepID=UPI000AF1E870|nr:SgcJ/EcaC family oxidoreductase [Caballeronia sordidicola]
MQTSKLFRIFLIAPNLLAWSIFATATQPSTASMMPQARVSADVQVSNAAQASNAPGRAAIEATIAQYFQALNHGNLDGVLTLYTDDPVLLPFLHPTVVGTEAVRKNYENTFPQIRFQMHSTIQELVQMSPEWAYVRTESAGIFTPTKTGLGAPTTFHELFLLRKTSDGKWHIARYSFSPTAKLPDF